ncbi:DNA (cytosine-5)-methyltransferase 3B-like [Genypterus blacodes]|uniref:DNA (cytosine-5)-methyltransferase 3B-like n=1 Tax=Genypterus blacodes TaxID=154954 RepID=UPI003F75C4CB
MVVNIKCPPGQLGSRQELLGWINQSLQSSYTTLEQVSTGVAYCQLMDRLIPGSVDLSRVRLKTFGENDIVHNFDLLLTAFRRNKVTRSIPVQSMLKRSSVMSLTFLHWFKLFFEANSEQQASAAGGGGGGGGSAGSRSPSSLPQELKNKTTEEPNRGELEEPLKENTEATMLISEDGEVETELSLSEPASQQTESRKSKRQRDDEEKDGSSAVQEDSGDTDHSSSSSPQPMVILGEYVVGPPTSPRLLVQIPHTLVSHSGGSPLQTEPRPGDLVWCQVEGFSVWPAIIRSCAGPQGWRVEWYGHGMSSQIAAEDLQPFADFTQCFCARSYATLFSYKDAIFMSLQEAAQRCGKIFSEGSKGGGAQMKRMLDWAFSGFLPSGPDGFKQAPHENGHSACRPQVKDTPTGASHSLSPSPPVSTSSGDAMEQEEPSVPVSLVSARTSGAREQSRGATRGPKRSRGGGATKEPGPREGGGAGQQPRGGTGRGRRGRGRRSVMRQVWTKASSAEEVLQRKREFAKIYKEVNKLSEEYTQPDQRLREEIISWMLDSRLDIEGVCLCCGTDDVEIFHPLFKGGLCLRCKNNLTETLYRYDEDGYQSYCTVCCYGLEVLLCGLDSCCRSYCADCLDILVGPGTFDSLKQQDLWICFLCQIHRPHRALIPREDWSVRVQEIFANNSAMEFEPHRVYPSVPASCRRPIRVLSLFDGIATGYLVLKDLGFKVEKYVASEVCEDSVAVATINHDRKIVHVDDVRQITKEHIQQWGPFDLLIGGSPCNDLSIVNPLRKGLYEGSGRLFFEFYRILQLLKPKGEDPRPFFWLFENVVFMNTHDKVNICRFLETNPVLVDAVKVSPAHRARYFWGNIPGMSRPITASQSDKQSLQDCLEIGRKAQVTKVRTITTNSNSLKQGKSRSMPVLQDGKEDSLWITELERIFGFPKHYTDVRNMNRIQRQKVLGKSWSVPVIRHLFAPLKDYFACEELPPVLKVGTVTSSAPSSPSSPASSESSAQD